MKEPQYKNKELIYDLMYQIDERVLSGTYHKHTFLVPYIKEKTGLKERQCYEIAKQAHDEYQQYLYDNLQGGNALKNSLFNLNRMMNMALTNQDLTNAIQAQKEINKILGLHSTNINLKTDIPYQIVFGSDTQQPTSIDYTPVKRLENPDTENDNFFDDL